MYNEGDLNSFSFDEIKEKIDTILLAGATFENILALVKSVDDKAYDFGEEMGYTNGYDSGYDDGESNADSGYYD